MKTNYKYSWTSILEEGWRLSPFGVFCVINSLHDIISFKYGPCEIELLHDEDIIVMGVRVSSNHRLFFSQKEAEKVISELLNNALRNLEDE